MAKLPKHYSFTQASDKTERAIITPCKITTPFRPELGEKPSKMLSCQALWDTGATNTVISDKLASSLGILPITKRKTFHADGDCLSNIYLVNIILPNNILISILQVSEGKLHGFDILIGMDIITQGNFSISNIDRKTTFSFTLPSICKIDFSQPHIIEYPVVDTSGVLPNDKCPCGSGKKFRHCCGKTY